MQAWLAVDDDLPARHGDVDAHLKQVAFAVVLVRHVHDDPAAHDVAVELVELGGVLADHIRLRLRMRQVMKGDLQGQLHGCHSFTMA